MNKFEYVYNEINEIYPDITEKEIDDLIEESLNQKTVQDMIVKYICFVKERYNG